MAFPRKSVPLVPRNRYLALVALAALSVCLIEITDLVQIPFESQIASAFGKSLVSTGYIVSLISGQGYLSLFVLMSLESASLPIPSEVVLPFAGYLAYQGSMNLFVAILVSTAALMAGALFDYFLALKVGRPFVDGALRRIGVKPESIARAEAWTNERGEWGVLLARFIPGLRSIISIPAGLFGMKLRPFVVMTLVGSIVWSTVLIYAGYSAGPLWDSVIGSSSGTLGTILLVVIALVSLVYLVYFALGGRLSKVRQD